jgi:nucleotide-binding universal stress UspA family protein
MEKPPKLLLAIDASKFVTSLLDQICRRNWPAGTQIRVLTVVGSASAWDVSEQYLHECQVILNDHVRRLRERLPACQVNGECMEGNPPLTIVEAARNWSVDLIIIGSHGDTGVRSDQVGSVAAAIVNTAPCSVLIIKVGGRSHHF